LSITSNLKFDRTDFRYDEHGGMTKILSFDPKTIERNRNAATTGSAWDAALFGMGVPMGGTVTVLHDLKSRPVEAQVRDANDDLVSRIVRRYNAEGLISEERPTLENPSALFLERMSPEERSQISPAQVQAMNKAMATMSRGQRETGKVYSYDAQGRVTQVRDQLCIRKDDHHPVQRPGRRSGGIHNCSRQRRRARWCFLLLRRGKQSHPCETPSATPERLPLPPPEEVHYS
jgi:hypothetical protein